MWSAVTPGGSCSERLQVRRTKSAEKFPRAPVERAFSTRSVKRPNARRLLGSDSGVGV